MMLRLVLLAFVLTAACSSSAEPEPVTVERRHFVVKKIELGAFRENVADFAWKDVGFDLDSRNTTKEDSKHSTNSCRRVEGSPTGGLTDGNDGLDNNFGQYVRPLLEKVAPFESAVQNDVTSGVYSFVLRVDVPSKDGPAPGALFVVGPHLGPPSFATDDRWPSMDQRVREFPAGRMRSGVWYAGFAGPPEHMWLPILGPTEVRAGVGVRLDLATGQGTMGVAIATSELTKAITPWLRAHGACPGSMANDVLLKTLSTSADLVFGAPNLQDTTRVCDAMSLGLRFEVVPVAPPIEGGAPPAPLASNCP